jgi:hypothetical protein
MSAKILVVRRGLGSSYYFYLSVFARENDFELLVDRRIGERRSPSQSSAVSRRSGERRRHGPPTDPDVDLLCVVEG